MRAASISSIWEVVDNSIDEAMAGNASYIELVIRADGSVMGRDNGRGIPVGKQKQTGKDALEVVHTVLHAGGKFGGGGYKVSGGLHGVGISVVNALSEYLRVETSRDGKIWRQEYSRGKPTTVVKNVGPSGGRTGVAHRVQARCPGLRDSRLQLRDHLAATARVRLSEQGRVDSVRRRARRRRRRSVRSISKAAS